eukprot:gene15287-biopygen3668
MTQGVRQMSPDFALLLMAPLFHLKSRSWGQCTVLGQIPGPYSFLPSSCSHHPSCPHHAPIMLPSCHHHAPIMPYGGPKVSFRKIGLRSSGRKPMTNSKTPSGTTLEREGPGRNVAPLTTLSI